MSANISTRVLVVDDSLTVRRLVEIAVRNRPIALEFATTGAEALAAILRSAPDLVLLDFVLPDMTGVDLCRELERRGLAKLPVVVISGNQLRIREQFDFYPNVLDYMSKPFGAADVVRVISSVKPAPRVDSIVTAPGALRSGGPLAVLNDAEHEVYSALVARELAIGVVSSLVALLGTGEVQIQVAGERVSLFVRGGAIAMVSTRNAARYCERSGFDVARIAPTVLSAALRMQTETAQPFVVSIASAFPDLDVDAWIHREGIELLKFALWGAAASKVLSIRGLKPAALPEFVNQHAAVISVQQIELLSLRDQQFESTSLDASAAVERVRGFSSHIVDFDLNDEERRILLVVTQRKSIERVLAEANLPGREAWRALSRLCHVGLLRSELDEEQSPLSQVKPALLMIATADVRGIVDPLRKTLGERRTPIAVEALGLPATWQDSVSQRRPAAVIVNVDEANSAGENFVRVLRMQPSFNGVALIALSERMDPQRITWLRGVGYDAFLETPFHLMAIEPFLLP